MPEDEARPIISRIDSVDRDLHQMQIDTWGKTVVPAGKRLEEEKGRAWMDEITGPNQRRSENIEDYRPGRDVVWLEDYQPPRDARTGRPLGLILRERAQAAFDYLKNMSVIEIIQREQKQPTPTIVSKSSWKPWQ